MVQALTASHSWQPLPSCNSSLKHAHILTFWPVVIWRIDIRPIVVASFRSTLDEPELAHVVSKGEKKKKFFCEKVGRNGGKELRWNSKLFCTYFLYALSLCDKNRPISLQRYWTKWYRTKSWFRNNFSLKEQWKNKHLNIELNFDHQMSLSKSKC